MASIQPMGFYRPCQNPKMTKSLYGETMSNENELGSKETSKGEHDSLRIGSDHDPGGQFPSCNRELPTMDRFGKIGTGNRPLISWTHPKTGPSQDLP